MKRTRNLLFVLMVGAGTVLQAQGRISAGVGYGRLMPLGGLAERFKSTEALSYRIGVEDQNSGRYLLQYRSFRFDRTNTQQLHFDSLQMNLDIESISLEYQRPVFGIDPYLDIRLGAGVSLQNWQFERAAFAGPDTSGVIVEAPAFEQEDWSWGAQLGAALTVRPLRFMQFGVATRYHFVVAELWPALRLQLENVSGLQFWDWQIFLEFSF